MTDYDPELDLALAGDIYSYIGEGSAAVVDRARLEEAATGLLRAVRAIDFKMTVKHRVMEAELRRFEATVIAPLQADREKVARQLENLVTQMYDPERPRIVTWQLPIGRGTYHAVPRSWSVEVTDERAAVDWLLEMGHDELVTSHPNKTALAGQTRKPLPSWGCDECGATFDPPDDGPGLRCPDCEGAGIGPIDDGGVEREVIIVDGHEVPGLRMTRPAEGTRRPGFAYDKPWEEPADEPEPDGADETVTPSE